ncbi:MAG: hypothetical protein RLZZ436_663 [Planctomycetota bacterium]|jgi:hypothetical protein
MPAGMQLQSSEVTSFFDVLHVWHAVCVPVGVSIELQTQNTASEQAAVSNSGRCFRAGRNTAVKAMMIGDRVQ